MSAPKRTPRGRSLKWRSSPRGHHSYHYSPCIVGLSFAGYDEIIGCGGVAVRPGDVMVCDNDGAVVIPAPMAAEVAEAGVEQERFERFVQQRVAQGASVVGLYPPDQGTLADYQRWLAAGEP